MYIAGWSGAKRASKPSSDGVAPSPGIHARRNRLEASSPGWRTGDKSPGWTRRPLKGASQSNNPPYISPSTRCRIFFTSPARRLFSSRCLREADGMRVRLRGAGGSAALRSSATNRASASWRFRSCVR
jgi:hypothetical protein